MCGILASINLHINTNVVNETMGHREPDERNKYYYKDYLKRFKRRT